MAKKIALFAAAALAATIIASESASVRSIRGQAAPSTPAHDAVVPLVHQDPGRCPGPSAPSGVAHAGEECSRYFGNVQRSDASKCGFAGCALVIRASDLVSAFVGTPVHGGEVSL